MDWKVFFATFGAIFLAELGDKTQLTNLAMATKSDSKVIVAIASITAFGIVTIITVFLGAAISRFIKPEYIRYGAALLFMAIGVLMFFGKI
jgi:putative Ca2+/H+ antiporter (TMEM165/GDT1 family)